MKIKYWYFLCVALFLIILFHSIWFAENFLNSWTSFSESSTFSWNHATTVWDNELNFFKFLMIMIPAAIADSINPCAFAVILLLLTWILSKTNSIASVYKAWFLFTFAVFISYMLMWIWLFSLFQTLSYNIWLVFYIKLFIWLLWVIIWLLNLKDFFWYDKWWFRMEVPQARKPKMKKVIDWIVSPWGAFLIWFIISLFLLPCTSWPYLTIISYLASEEITLKTSWIIYLLIYNIIFVLPMVIITVIVWTWWKSTKYLAKLRKDNIKNIHLIVWILMLLLWLYILNELFNVFESLIL